MAGTSNGNIICSGVTYCGAQSAPPIPAVAPIDPWGTCRWVDNIGTNALFVPFRTSREWQKFLATTSAPPLSQNILLTPCGEPFTETGATQTQTLNVLPTSSLAAPYAACAAFTMAGVPAQPSTDAKTCRWPATVQAALFPLRDTLRLPWHNDHSLAAMDRR